MNTFSAITIPETQEMLESLTMIGTGFIVVMSVLCFLWLSISITGWVFVARQGQASSGDESAAETTESNAEETADEIPATTLALIAAAVQTVVSAPHRIVGIEQRQPNREAQAQASHWSVEGRRSIFSSHQVR